MKNKTRINIFLLITAGIISLLPVLSGASESDTIKGVYGNPKLLWEKEGRLSNLGINAIFVRSGLINDELMKKARAEGLKVFAEFATLNGKNYVDEHPEAWAINAKGEKVEFASWFMGVCPTEPGFRQYREDLLRDLVTNHKIDGVWLDYVHWHAQFEEHEPILPETCFCVNCLSLFSEYSGMRIPAGTVTSKAKWILENQDEVWRDWRCSVIYDWAYELNVIMKGIHPEALLGLYHCPWNDEEYNGARRRNLGLDFDFLKNVVDVFSPMVYHARMEREAGWVGENVSWLCDRLDVKDNSWPQVWPIVQAHNSPRVITADEFETVLKSGMSGRTTGVMMFTANSIAEDEEKAAVLKKVYGAVD